VFLVGFPLLIIPFALYNMVAFLLNLSISEAAFTFALHSGGRLSIEIGDGVVIVGALLFYVEALKATWQRKPVTDHILSMLLFAGMVAELLMVPAAATASFLVLTVLSFLDVLVGLSIRSPEPPDFSRRSEPDLPEAVTRSRNDAS
jgi:hypothetical protein